MSSVGLGGESKPPDKSTPGKVYPNSPNVIVKQLPCYDESRPNEPPSMVTVVQQENGDWTMESASDFPMRDLPNQSKRCRSESEDESSVNEPPGAVCKKKLVEKQKQCTDPDSINIEGSTNLRPDKGGGPNSGSQHLDSNGGKRFNNIIIASATSLNIFANPKITRELLTKGGFEKYLDKGIEVKGRGRSVRLTVEVCDIIEFSKIKKLGDYDVHCWTPLSTTQHVGVVSPVHVDMDLATDFLPGVQILGGLSDSSKITDVKRLKKGGKELDLVKIIFEGRMPDKISWNHQVFSVRPFIHDPIRCFKCQLYGHGSNSCTGKMVCPYCCKNHALSECNYKKVTNPLCFHCRKGHMSGSRECEFFKEASTMENKKQANKVTYEECKKFYVSLNNRASCDTGRFTKPRAPFRVTDVLGSTPPRNNYVGQTAPNGSSRDANRFAPLSDLDDSEESDLITDFFMTVDESKSPSASRRRRKLVKCKPKTFADSPSNNTGKVESTSGVSNSQSSTQRQNSPVICSEYNNLLSKNSPNNSSSRNSGRKMFNDKNLNSNSSKLGPLDFTMGDIKDSILFKLLGKVLDFLQTKNKSLVDWLNFFLELYNYVDQNYLGSS